MLEIYLCTALILVASLLVGRAILLLLGRPDESWLSGAAGFAALVVIAPFAIRLPEQAATAAIWIGALAVIAGVLVVRARAWPRWEVGLAVVALTLLLATVPFVLHDRVGVLGEGIYTNDHAAQLYWADWLQNGFGPEPKAVQFGYPIGPQAIAATVAEATGATLVEAFNGLLLATAALTGLTALGALSTLPPGRRIAIATMAALPYLAASFLAQSAFKETAMALFVLAFALLLGERERAGWRAVAVVGLILAAASVLTFSIPGLAWFALALPLWLAAETVAGRSPIDWRELRGWVGGHRRAVAVGALAAAALTAVAIGPAIDFVGKIGDVQESAGRLSSPVFPGEVFGLWPEGDFRIVRGEVSGGLIAAAVGLAAVGYGAVRLIRRREWALPAMLVAGGIVYVGARVFAEIHVEAKALAIVAPLVLLVALRGLLEPGEREPATFARYTLGALLLAGALASTLLALRAAPIGYDDRQGGLETLAERIDGESVAFLGVDRFAGYYLRGTLARAPAGYVPEEIASRPEKTWQQGDPADFDSLEPGKLDKFRYAITTGAAYASSPPANFEPVVESGDYVLWRRRGETPRSRVLPGENGAPGETLDCAEIRRRPGEATVLTGFERMPFQSWETPAPTEDSAGGQELGFAAPGEATARVPVDRPGVYRLSLQYHSQVPLEVLVGNQVIAELPASLEGMYLSGAGRGAFWPAGELDSVGAAVTSVEVTVRAGEPTGLEEIVGAERRVWLGDLAATRDAPATVRSLASSCGRYVDHFVFDRKDGG